ncbi:hypothetical protein NDS46_16270 [Paenibacillus thiaminolyticus]|uniref:hypothetical protein n=1 Tax=Paenibacillus thiaminolyticus TaxID=49283 RepID=UPI00232FE25A|nr:hypothetical protein [Paenibacillus thiaminolyticus]WCF05931.1 hypothetical protein NDS46_16270 [Paenibacillus thiaminolyticus]
MKQLTVFLLVALILLSLSACGIKSDSGKDGKISYSPPTKIPTVELTTESDIPPEPSATQADGNNTDRLMANMPFQFQQWTGLLEKSEYDGTLLSLVYIMSRVKRALVPI